MGQTNRAEEIMLRAKKNIINSANQNQADLLYIEKNLGFVYINSLEYEKGERSFLEAKELCNTLALKESMDCSEVDRGLGTLYFQTGRYEKSLKMFNVVKDKMSQLGMENSGLYGALLINMGNSFERLSDFDKALEYYNNAKKIWEQIAGKTSNYYLNCLLNMAVVYSQKHEYTLAIKYFEETAPLLEKIAGRNSREYFLLNLNFGNCYNKVGNYKEAQQRFSEAIGIADSLYGNLHEFYALAANGLSWSYYNFGQENDALDCTLKSFNAISNTLSLAVSYLTEEELGQFKASLDHVLTDLFRMSHNYSRNNSASSMAYNQALFLKGYLLSAIIKTKKTALQNPETKQLFLKFQEKNKSLTELLSKPKTERSGQIEMEDTIHSLQKEMVLKMKTLDFDFNKTDWSVVQKKLSSQSAAIEFVDYFDSEIKENHYYSALILKTDQKAPIFVKLFSEIQLDSIITAANERKSEYVNKLYTIADRGAAGIEAPKKSLYELIWKPLEKELAGIKTIYFSPGGLLHRINLDAIPISETETLADKYQLIALNSTRQLVIPTQVKIANNDAILYGGIQFEQDSTNQNNEPILASRSRGMLSFSSVDTTLRGGIWNYLSGTEREVSSIEKIMQDAGVKTTLKKGYFATEESFKTIGANNSASPKILHIATHGYFFPDPKEQSKSSGLSGQNEPVFKISDHPMLRSGLIMAGGNAAWQGKQTFEGKEDGILTAYEISQMNLSNTELVVLSACETGLGDIQGNEGVYGLQRAFKIAGAKYLIMSLWQVPDKQTSLLMTTFYKKWLEDKMTIPDAFHAAQKELREIGLDPYQWAGFVLVE